MSCNFRLLLALGLAGALGGPASAAEPLFSRHVEAVFSRLGCNGGTCHGAVKGQNGFALSLFGADPDGDHERLVRGGEGRRLNLLAPTDSLLLLKATGGAAHGGGRLTRVGSPEYEILRRWIAAGAAKDAPAKSRVARLVVAPARHTARAGRDRTACASRRPSPTARPRT